jgi:hypothetical protein
MNEFSFIAFNRRRNSEVTYRLEIIEDGWFLTANVINGKCDPSGEPYLYMNLRQDNINYPSGLGRYLAWIWEQIDAGVIDNQEVKSKIEDLASWVSNCEKDTPVWEGWTGK